MRRLRVIVFLFILLGAAVNAWAAERDFQYWAITSVSWKMADNWKLSLGEETYFKDNGSDFYYEHTELGVIYSGLAKWLDVGLNFRHALSENSRKVWKREEQPSFQGIFKTTLKGFAITDRNRFEYRIKEDADDAWRYRNLLTIRPPWKWTRLEIQPYFLDEFFVDFDNKEVNENRMEGGASFKINKYLGFDVFYRWRRIKSTGKWSSQDILGTRLKLLF